jgi:hypothetical protein
MKVPILLPGTLIPLGLALSVIGGGSIWVTTFYVEFKQEQKENVTFRERQEKSRDAQDDKLDIILEKVIRMEEIIKHLQKR